MTRILIAEDEEDIMELLVFALGEAGFEIIEAKTGDAASLMLDAEPPNLLLTNINMPGSLNGINLARLARTRYPKMPVLFITGRPDELERAAEFDKPSAVLAKPFSLQDIVAAVQKFVGESEDR